MFEKKNIYFERTTRFCPSHGPKAALRGRSANDLKSQGLASSNQAFEVPEGPGRKGRQPVQVYIKKIFKQVRSYMNVLITGFEPFGNETINPSYEAIKQLPGRIGDAAVLKAKIPVSFADSGPVLEAAIARHQPDIVICVGQAGGYAGIAVERTAINLQDASIPDNDGMQPEDRSIAPDGPNAYFSSLPVKQMVRALRQEGIPAFISNSAGTYVCNHLMYTLLHTLHRKNPAVKGGFIHVPYSMEQAAGKTPAPPSMELRQIVRALEVCIQAIL